MTTCTHVESNGDGILKFWSDPGPYLGIYKQTSTIMIRLLTIALVKEDVENRLEKREKLSRKKLKKHCHLPSMGPVAQW